MRSGVPLVFGENMYDDDDVSSDVRFAAKQLFHEAYEAQLAHEYERAIELYKRSIETYPTAEAHTFLGWVYSFQLRYDEAIEECLAAITVDETLGNPYNDIGSYLLAQGDIYGSVRWFKRALLAPRYESYAFPHFNLGRVYETRRKFLDAAKHYGLALEQKPDFTEAAVALRRMQTRLN
jgi:tetratricopeptide (TPR) repeat protein